MILGLLMLGSAAPDARGPGSRTMAIQKPVIQKVDIAGLASFIAHCDHPLIVNFWATFCDPCIKEMPYLQSVAGRYKEEGVELVLVSLDRPRDYPDRIAAFAKKNGLSARVLWLSENNAGASRARVDEHWSGGLPSSLFINRATGYRRFFDRQLTGAQVEPAIKEMLR
jgi:thiol-disulfide isomerase/thioredoxin